MHKWSVVACDQYTSEPKYWEEVESIVGDAPSTLKITLPEIYLEQDNVGCVLLGSEEGIKEGDIVSFKLIETGKGLQAIDVSEVELTTVL